MTPLKRLLHGLAACGVMLVACDRQTRLAPAKTVTPSPAAPWFDDVTEQLRLEFTHDPGKTGELFMPEMVGSGAALFDFDSDGRLDIYLLQNAGRESASKNTLLHQENDGTFRNVSAGSGLDVSGRGMGVAVGDVDNDGAPDVLVCEFGGARLFRNLGGGRFVELGPSAGIDNPHWASAAAFLDYDRDGWLDVVIVNYVAYDPSTRCNGPNGLPDYCGPTAFKGTVSRLFHNRGTAPGVRFEDVTLKAGLARAAGAGLGVVCADFDGDRWPDIFVTNDAAANTLWLNQHDGSFKDEAVLRGIAYNGIGRSAGNMGIALGDIDGDNAFDIFVTHLTEENHALWQQAPAGLFQDRTAATGLTAPRWHGTGFGAVLADFDQDAAPDLAIVNGRVRRAILPDAGRITNPDLPPHWNQYAERNQLFRNDRAGPAPDGRRTFRDISLENDAFCKMPRVGRALAFGDVTGDGAVDLLVTNVAEAARLYQNVAPERGHWLLVRAVEPAFGGRDAYGATVTLRTGPRRHTGWVVPASSYQASHDVRVHFGLGSASQIDGIEVIWPDGSSELFPGGPVDRQLVLEHGKGVRQ